MGSAGPPPDGQARARLTGRRHPLDHRDHAEGGDGRSSHASDERKYAPANGRKAAISVETGNSEPTRVSFRHLKEADLERGPGLAEKALAPQPAFAGFVIRHYRSYRNWLDSQKKKD